MKWIVGSRGIGKTQKLVEFMIDNHIHHIFCGYPESMRERVHAAGGRDIAIYHYSDISTMNELDGNGVAYVIDDLDVFLRYRHSSCVGTTMSTKGD